MLAKSREGVKGYIVNPDGVIMALTQGTDLLANVKMIEGIANGGRYVTAKSQEIADHYREVFGFEELDGMSMKLSDTALALYTNNKGKVTATSVRDNLGGFANENFSPAVRFSKDARSNLDQIAEMSQAEFNKNDAEFIQSGNYGFAVTSKIHEWRDSAMQNVDRFASALEQEFLEKFGGRKARMIFGGSGRKLNTNSTELLQKAMNLYIDSGTGSNLKKVEAYVKKLAAKGKALTGREYQQLDIMERMLTLTEEERAWADSTIRPYYEDFFSFAQEHELINSHVDNYVKRMWKMPKELRDRPVTWSGGATTGFQVIPTSGKPRSFDSIVDGWEAGMDLKGHGVIGNLQTYANEIGYTFANRRFVEYMRSLKDFKTDGVMFEVDPKTDPDFRPGPNYTQITIPGFAKPFHKLYARDDVANLLNRMGMKASHQIWDTDIAKFPRRISAMIKSTLLSISLFHHMAGLRSYRYGVPGQNFRGFKAYREGLKKIEEQTNFEPENLKKLGPAVDFLVKEGLTLGKTQDWDEAMLQESMLEDILSGRKGKASRRLLEAWQGMRRRKRSFTTGLFNRLFAGLKAQSAVMEMVHSTKKQEKKLGRALTEQELKLTAQQTATLINADFGGLHLGRMGRNPDLQRAAQLALLAPDWTESNWRTVTGMFKMPDRLGGGTLNNWINRRIGDNPELEGMTQVYRRFWKGAAMKVALDTALAQAAVLALFADEDERKEYFQFWKAQFKDLGTFSKGRWIALDFTPVARKLGIGDPEKRQQFSIAGHFKDILKVADLASLVKHKVGPIGKAAESFASMTDWKDSNFSSLEEILETGSLVSDNPFEKAPDGTSGMLSQSVAWFLYNLRGAAPIPLQEAASYLQGEQSGLATIARMGGADLREVSNKPAGQEKYEEINSEINELNKNLKDAQTVGDRRMIVEARKDIKRYDREHRNYKSQIGFTKVRLRPVNREIKDLTLKDETKGLTDREQRKLSRAKEKRAKIYAKFLKVIER
jgi:hypothetical protein